MKKVIYILNIFLILCACNLRAQVSDGLVPDLSARDSIFLENISSYKGHIKDKDSIYTYVPEAWDLKPEKNIDRKNLQNHSVATTAYGYTDLSHIPSSHPVDKSKDPGEIYIIQGESNGALTYSVPFDIYKSENGFNPEVFFGYNSQNTNGAGGMGWQIGGLSSISATNSTQYYDNISASVKLNKDCAFLLDGIRLINLNTSTATTINYESERGNIKATAYLDGDQIKYFMVKYPDGRVGTYGFTYNTTSRISYPLTKMEDLRSNLIEYSYSQNDNTYYLTAIHYGHRTGTSAHASVQFSYEDRKDVTTYYVDGLDVRISKRLKEVTTYFTTQLLRTYQFTYDTASPSLLKQISCLSNGRELNPLLFYYGENNQLIQFEKSDVLLSSYFANSSVPNLILTKGKFDYSSNSDGLVSYPKVSNWDVIATKKNWLGNVIAYQYGSKYHADQSLLIYKDLSSGLSFPLKLTAESGFLKMLPVDVDGDGIDEIVKINSTVINSSTERLTFKVYSLSGKYGQGTPTPDYTFTVDLDGVCSWEDLNSPSPKNYIVGDFLGNGKQSILCLSYNKNAKNETVSSKATLIEVDNRRKSPTHNQICFSYDFEDYVYALDFDGDGKTELCVVNSEGTYVYSFNSSGTLVKTASTSAITRSSLYRRELLLGDINGDGKTDLVVSPKKDDYDHERYHYGTCIGCCGKITPDRESADGSVLIYFCNSDGSRACTISKYPTKIYRPDAKKWSVYYSTGREFTPGYSDITYYEGDAKFALQDMNGDNIPDLVVNSSGQIKMYLTHNGVINTSPESHTCAVNSSAHFITGSVEQNYKMSQLFTLYNEQLVPITFTRDDTQQRLLTGVINSLGVINKHLYTNVQSGSSYYKGTKCTYPYMNLSGRFYVLKQFQTYVNNLLVAGFSYNYHKGILDVRGRGFLGFEKVIKYDDIRGWNTIQTYDPYNFSILKKEETPHFTTSYFHSVSVDGNKFAKVRMISKSVKDNLKDFIIYYDYTYDKYGNLTKEVTDYGSGIKTTTVNSYYNYTGTIYKLGDLYEQVTTKERNESKITEKLAITYDAKRQPLTKKRYINDNIVSEEKLEYDPASYNIKIKKSRPYSSTEWLVQNYSYDSYHRMTSYTNILGHVEKYEYNDKGQLSTIENHKNQTTRFEYDSWNKKIKETYPDNTITAVNYDWVYSPANAVYSIVTTTTGKPTTQSFYDVLGREIRSGELRFDGKYLYTDHVYDSRGRLQKTSLPFKGSDPTLWNTFTYDTYDRLTQVTYASGKKDTYSYSKNNVTIVVDGISTTKTYDTTGAITSVTGLAGAISYSLRADGQILSSVSPGAVVTTFEYDTYGRQIAITDPSAGRKTFSYDEYGNVKQEINANGKSIKYKYDEYGRMIQKEMVGEQTVTYNFNTDGLLIKEQSTNGTSKDYTYDRYFRVSTEKETGVDGKWLIKEYTYSKNNLNTINYISNTGGIATEKYYHNNGNLTEIKVSRSLSAIKVDTGSMVKVDAEKELSPKSVSVGKIPVNNDLVWGSTSIWKLTDENDLGQVTGANTGELTRNYSYDAYGLPTGRMAKAGSNVIQNYSYSFDPCKGNLTWRRDNTRNLQENFGYDNLNRLTRFNYYTINYDIKGNITEHSGVGKFGYSSNKPFAIETLTTHSAKVPLRNQFIHYNAMMRPVSITETMYAATYTYNGNGDRVKMLVKNKEVNELTRYYIGNQYEIETGVAGDKEILYLGGDCYSAPAVYIKEGSGEWTINYICRDYLGSITHITDSKGKLRQELSYDPWGRLRNPDDHVIYSPGTEPVLLLSRGFTGHEHLTMFSLINMNARLYDPILGRFLSPDPYVQDPFYSQNFNRYSYCWNNPLRFTDPDGEWVHIVVGAVFGGVINWVANGCQFNAKGLGYFGAGAAAGALTAAFGPAGAAAGGALLGASNAALDGGNMKDILLGTTVGAISGVAGGYAGKYASKYLGDVVINGFKVSSPVLKGAIGGSIGGGAGGYVGGFTAGYITTGDLEKAHQAGWNSAVSGFAIGGVMGGGAGAKWAHDNNKNMWTGKDLNPTNTSPNQVHHFATDKNSKFTPEMRQIAEEFGLDLDGTWNKQSLPHQGRHASEYHNFVLEQMRIIRDMPGMNQQKFLHQFDIRVKQVVIKNPQIMYKNYWTTK